MHITMDKVKPHSMHSSTLVPQATVSLDTMSWYLFPLVVVVVVLVGVDSGVIVNLESNRISGFVVLWVLVLLFVLVALLLDWPIQVGVSWL